MVSHHVLTLICYVTITKVLHAAKTSDLVVPKETKAFSRDVAVRVNNAIMGQIVELFAHNQTEAITAQVITKTSETSTLIFNCGYFLHIGEYYFRLKSGEQTIATSLPITATKWPTVSINWKRKHVALTTDVKITFEIDGPFCKSDIARQNQLSLKLRKQNEDNDSKVATESIFRVHPSSENFIPTYFIIPCEQFQEAGSYDVKLVMTSPAHDDLTIATSDVIDVGWSNEYDLKIQKKPFPCQGYGVDLYLSFPPCASTLDTVQLVAVINGTEKIVQNIERGERDHVTFPCSAFYNVNQSVSGFCFKYITKSGYVARTICEPTNQDSEFDLPGVWSAWSSWATCSRPCLRPVERRKRLCNNPEPQGKGGSCESENGEGLLEEMETLNVVERHTTCNNDAMMTYLMTSSSTNCECGCFMPIAQRGIVMSSVTNDCFDSGTIIWRVRVPKGHVIKFRLSDYQLANDEMLTIRDGMTSWPLTSQYPTVTSKSSFAMVQWVKSRTKNNLDSCGFILSYEASAKPTPNTWAATATEMGNATNSDGAPSGFLDWVETSIKENPVVIGGVGACGLIIVIVVAVVVVHYRRRRRQKQNTIPPGCHTPMSTRLTMPPDGRSCSNDDTESEPMVRPRPIGDSAHCDVIQDTCIPMQAGMNTGTAYYLAQRQLELMKRLGKDEHSQTYATACLSEETLRQQEELLFGDRRSLHKNTDLKVT